MLGYYSNNMNSIVGLSTPIQVKVDLYIRVLVSFRKSRVVYQTPGLNAFSPILKQVMSDHTNAFMGCMSGLCACFSSSATPNWENQFERKELPAASLTAPHLLLISPNLNRSTFRPAAPPRTVPTAPTPAQKTTALWFCLLQTPAARAQKSENTTIAIAAAAARLFLPFPTTPSLPCRTSASALAPKKARLAAARLALPPGRSDWSRPTPGCPPPSARSVPAAPGPRGAE